MLVSRARLKNEKNNQLETFETSAAKRFMISQEITLFCRVNMEKEGKPNVVIFLGSLLCVSGLECGPSGASICRLDVFTLPFPCLYYIL